VVPWWMTSERASATRIAVGIEASKQPAEASSPTHQGRASEDRMIDGTTHKNLGGLTGGTG
jgi:hypothetical protein